MLRYFDGEPVSGRLVYRHSERSLNVEPPPRHGVTSLLVNDVQIAIDEDGNLIYVWGLCPRESWKSTTLETPPAKSGCLQYVNSDTIPGVSKRLNTAGRWLVHHDPLSQWLCIGDESAEGEGVAFAPDAVAVLRREVLVALWLHPDLRP